MNHLSKVILLALSAITLGGCVGARTFHEIARAGDTVAVATGWKQNFTRDNITITITPSAGTPIIIPPNDPAIAAIVNLYPDPVSSLIVSRETGQDLTPYARTYSGLVSNSFTGGDKDWWETTVFIHLPDTLPLGTTSIAITDPQGESMSSTVEIVDGVGKRNTFASTTGQLNTYQIASLQRLTHYTVSFTASTIPYAIQVDMTHDPDKNNGGSGLAYAVNPRGELKSLNWSDTGTSMRVLLTPARTQALNNIKDFKFYVSGGITGLTISGIKAVDANGNTVAGVSASVN